MSRRYSDKEMSLILAKAAELSMPSREAGEASSDLTLEEIKAIAAEVGLDPALVDRAARLVSAPTRPSIFARLTGGPMRQSHEIAVPARLTPEASERLLAVIRGNVDLPEGLHNADASSVLWQSEQGNRRLAVTAHSDHEGTRLRVRVERAGDLAKVAVWTSIGTILPAWVLIEGVDSYGDALLLSILIGGVITVGRWWWSSTSRRVRAQVDALLDAMSRSLERAPPEVDEGEE